MKGKRYDKEAGVWVVQNDDGTFSLFDDTISPKTHIITTSTHQRMLAIIDGIKYVRGGKSAREKETHTQ